MPPVLQPDLQSFGESEGVYRFRVTLPDPGLRPLILGLVGDGQWDDAEGVLGLSLPSGTPSRIAIASVPSSPVWSGLEESLEDFAQHLCLLFHDGAGSISVQSISDPHRIPLQAELPRVAEFRTTLVRALEAPMRRAAVAGNRISQHVTDTGSLPEFLRGSGDVLYARVPFAGREFLQADTVAQAFWVDEDRGPVRVIVIKDEADNEVRAIYAPLGVALMFNSSVFTGSLVLGRDGSHREPNAQELQRLFSGEEHSVSFVPLKVASAGPTQSLPQDEVCPSPAESASVQPVSRSRLAEVADAVLDEFPVRRARSRRASATPAPQSNPVKESGSTTPAVAVPVEPSSDTKVSADSSRESVPVNRPEEGNTADEASSRSFSEDEVNELLSAAEANDDVPDHIRNVPPPSEEDFVPVDSNDEGYSSEYDFEMASQSMPSPMPPPPARGGGSRQPRETSGRAGPQAPATVREEDILENPRLSLANWRERGRAGVLFASRVLGAAVDTEQGVSDPLVRDALHWARLSNAAYRPSGWGRDRIAAALEGPLRNAARSVRLLRIGSAKYLARVLPQGEIRLVDDFGRAVTDGSVQQAVAQFLGIPVEVAFPPTPASPRQHSAARTA